MKASIFNPLILMACLCGCSTVDPKPPTSNWFVSYQYESVDKKHFYGSVTMTMGSMRNYKDVEIARKWIEVNCATNGIIEPPLIITSMTKLDP